MRDPVTCTEAQLNYSTKQFNLEARRLFPEAVEMLVREYREKCPEVAEYIQRVNERVNGEQTR